MQTKLLLIATLGLVGTFSVQAKPCDPNQPCQDNQGQVSSQSSKSSHQVMVSPAQGKSSQGQNQALRSSLLHSPTKIELISHNKHSKCITNALKTYLRQPRLTYTRRAPFSLADQVSAVLPHRSTLPHYQ